MKYYDLMDKEEKGSFITFENQYEAKEWLINQTKRFPQDGLHIVENERLTIYEKYEALKHPQQVLFFLFDIITYLNYNCLQLNIVLSESARTLFRK